MGDPIIERARAALAGACKRGYIQMCVPVQADDDDMLIVAALDHADALLARVERLEAALRAVMAHEDELDCRGVTWHIANDALVAAEPAG